MPKPPIVAGEHTGYILKRERQYGFASQSARMCVGRSRLLGRLRAGVRIQ